MASLLRFLPCLPETLLVLSLYFVPGLQTEHSALLTGRHKIEGNGIHLQVGAHHILDKYGFPGEIT